ncbi:MAG: hypothetical protein ABFD89_12095 [Bryobacteraceae bacterium]
MGSQAAGGYGQAGGSLLGAILGNFIAPGIGTALGAGIGGTAGGMLGGMAGGGAPKPKYDIEDFQLGTKLNPGYSAGPNAGGMSPGAAYGNYARGWAATQPPDQQTMGMNSSAIMDMLVQALSDDAGGAGFGSYSMPTGSAAHAAGGGLMKPMGYGG